MKVIPTEVPGVFVLEPRLFEDDRGSFHESWNRQRWAELGLHADFVQDNHSVSKLGTLRGLHFQNPHAQVKLCRVSYGEVFDVCVDVRRGSPTFGKSVCVTLSAKNRRQLWIPAGFAHGFWVTSNHAEFLYKCSDYYSREDERGIAWNDPALAIPWPAGAPILSGKDAALPPLSALADELPSFE